MKQTNNQKLQNFSTNCKNKKVVDSYIKNYQIYTKNTVENILKVSSLVLEMKNKQVSGELDDSDMKYFCFSVGLSETSSTFRKFKRIGECANKFRHYIDKLPDSYTVLYEITTLDEDLFEKLMKNNEIHSYVTLKDIKRLSNKVANHKQMKNYDSFRVIFDLKSMSKESKKQLAIICRCLYQMSDVEFMVPKSSQFAVGMVNPVTSSAIDLYKKTHIEKQVTSVEFEELRV